MWRFYEVLDFASNFLNPSFPFARFARRWLPARAADHKNRPIQWKMLFLPDSYPPSRRITIKKNQLRRGNNREFIELVRMPSGVLCVAHSAVNKTTLFRRNWLSRRVCARSRTRRWMASSWRDHVTRRCLDACGILFCAPLPPLCQRGRQSDSPTAYSAAVSVSIYSGISLLRVVRMVLRCPVEETHSVTGLAFYYYFKSPWPFQTRWLKYGTCRALRPNNVYFISW